VGVSILLEGAKGAKEMTDDKKARQQPATLNLANRGSEKSREVRLIQRVSLGGPARLRGTEWKRIWGETSRGGGETSRNSYFEGLLVYRLESGG